MKCSLVLLAVLVLQFVQLCYSGCYLWPAQPKKGKSSECEDDSSGTYPNLPILNGVYCYNNGSGICKAFAGRFEFYLNTFTDEFIGPVEASEDVDKYGYHRRVPVSYNINGAIFYADRSINWGVDFAKSLEGREISLLSTQDFTWCAFVEDYYWPFKSAIKDVKTGGKYHIYFHNRQSCIYNTETKKFQHYNTRFLHNSQLRMDLDMNPIIFAMEDHVANETRLVKNKRQHWYEVEYNVIEQPGGSANIRYFVNMSTSERKPLKLTQGPLLSRKAYRNHTEVCLDDHYHKREGKNALLVMPHCGIDEVEISDYPIVFHKHLSGQLIEVDLHNLPRHPTVIEKFYGLNITDDSDWLKFANDGFTFSATTTVPIEGQDRKVQVISLYSDYKAHKAKDEYDEYYPTPFLSIYESEFIGNSTDSGDWKFDRNSKAQKLTNLNYVDDIAYLYACKTVLIVYGPLYSEVPPGNFSINTKAKIGPIKNLGIWEIANALFAMPDNTNFLWVYHRTNFLQKLKYTCGSGGKLVTAEKADGKYVPRHGLNQPSWIRITFSNDHPFIEDRSEETFFKALGLFKGSLDSPEAPDPSKYPLSDYKDPVGPAAAKTNMLIYIIVAIAIILIVVMCAVCMLTMRRHRKSRRHGKSSIFSFFSSPTARSSTLPGSNLSDTASTRSGLKSKLPSGSRASIHASPTARSSVSKGRSKSSRSSFGAHPTSRSMLVKNSSSPSSKSNLPSRGSGLDTRRSSQSSKPSSKSKKPKVMHTVRSH